jgi:hypothetical protein
LWKISLDTSKLRIFQKGKAGQRWTGESKALDAIREEFKKEFGRSKKVTTTYHLMRTFIDTIQLTDIVKATVPQSKKKYYLSY